MRRGLTLALLVLAFHALSAPGQQKGKAAKPTVQVLLSFSEAEFDPGMPKVKGGSK